MALVRALATCASRRAPHLRHFFFLFLFGSIIMQPGVIEAAERGVYDNHIAPLSRFTPTGIAWDGVTMKDHEGMDVHLPAGEAEVRV